MRVIKLFVVLIVLTMLLCGNQFLTTIMATESITTELSANYLTISGGESTIRIMVENKDLKPHRYNLQTFGLPDGLKTYFTLDGKLVDGLDLPASDKGMVELHLIIPLGAEQDNGSIKIRCIREDGIETLMPVSFTVNHDYTVEITNSIKKLEAMNGKSLSFDIAITNTGNKVLEGLGLRVDLPYKWTLETVTPEKLNLKAGENGVFRLNVSIPSSQASGNSTIKIKSFNGNVASKEITVPVTVTASAGYAWWAIGLVLVFGIVTYLYFRKHGRR